MTKERKGQSPFYPGQPVPVEFFVGRSKEIERIKRAAVQVAAGKPQAVFITGEYGIGKSSLARFVRVVIDDTPGLIGFHVLLGGANSLSDISTATVQTIASSSQTKPKMGDKIREALADYIGEQSLFGVFQLHLEKLRKDAPDIAKGYLPFLRKIYEQVKDEYKGIVLIFDEINGMASKPSFGSFLKSLVDENALSDNPLPLLLILCGTDERHREIIENHRPVERIFEIAHIDTMSNSEMHSFFNLTFGKVNMQVDEGAMSLLCDFSGGFPKLMHLLGDAAFWISEEKSVDENEAFDAVLAAAEDVGRKFVDKQVYSALRSKDYRNILNKVSRSGLGTVFKKSDIEKGLSKDEKKKFNNFLQRMKRLKVLSSGEELGEYVFRDRLTRLYCRMIASKIGK